MNIAKIFLILIVASIIECTGVALLASGLKQLHAPAEISPGGIIRVVREGAVNGRILLGIALEAVFFGVLLYLLSKKDVSFVWPLTSLGFVFTTLAAYFLLDEKISLARWAGVLLITLGAGLVGYTEAVKHPPSAPNAANASPLRPQ